MIDSVRLARRLRLSGNSRSFRQSGYKGGRRVLVRWHRELTGMLLHARARGDQGARIDVDGIVSPGVEYSNGSVWILALGRQERKEERQLRTGKVPHKVKRKRRPEGVYFGQRQGGPVCLLKPRVQTRPMCLRK